jgi:hypothetical protein
MDPLPEFTFSYDGLIEGDVVEDEATILRDNDGVPYDESSDESAGRYTVTPVAWNNNYLFQAETSILHVNPYGPGTKAVRPVLNCIQQLDTDYYVANFTYKNDNDYVVYIPEGPDNLLEGTGIDALNSDEVPTFFQPGGGEFRIFFDGTDITWTVSSREDEKKVRNAAGANANSTKCPNNVKSASVYTGIEELLGPNVLEAYPNPVTEVVYLSLNGIEKYRMIDLYDLSGKSCAVNPSASRSDLLEIDMSSLPGGPYFIRVVMEDAAMVVPIIKK